MVTVSNPETTSSTLAAAAVWGPVGLILLYGGARAGTAALSELRNVIFSKVG